MKRPVYIGSELEACGYRLTGMRVVVPGDRDLSGLLRDVRDRASLILLSATVAAALPLAVLDEAILEARPPLAVLPDIDGAARPPDLTREVRAALGVL